MHIHILGLVEVNVVVEKNTKKKRFQSDREYCYFRISLSTSVFYAWSSSIQQLDLRLRLGLPPHIRLR